MNSEQLPDSALKVEVPQSGYPSIVIPQPQSQPFLEKASVDLFVGVLAGVLTTVLLYLIKVFWDTKLSPWLRESRYTGVMIEGTWVGGAKDDATQTATDVSLILEQSARDLTGIYTVKHVSPDNSFELVYRASGHVWEGYVMLSFHPIDRHHTSCASALLKIGGGGVALVGQFAFRNVNSEAVTSDQLVLTRRIGS
jgi:hypothetical protein